MDVGWREQTEQRQAGPTTEQGMQPVAQQEGTAMVGRRMAEGGVGIGPAPGQDGGAVDDEVAPTGHPNPQPLAHQ